MCCRNVLPIEEITLFDSLNYLEKTSYVLGSELWERIIKLFAVKGFIYIVDVCIGF